MNPPFPAAVQHVKHAMGFLGGGQLVAVLPESVLWDSDRASVELRELVSLAEGTFAPQPDESFAPSGTSVRTVSRCRARQAAAHPQLVAAAALAARSGLSRLT